MKTLFIDTTDNKEIIVGVFLDSKKYFIRKKLMRQKAQVVLPLIERLLKKHKLALQDIDGIEVKPGPGSFTGVRVGVSVANALSFALGIPVNGGKILVEPIYSS